MLFAGLLAMTRLAQDSEIKAALLLGLSPKNFALPLLGLGLVISLLSFVNNELIVPWSNARALEVQKDIFLKTPDIFLSEGSFFTDALGRSVHIDDLQAGGVAKGITVIQSDGSRGPKEVVFAETGLLDEEAGLWRLEEVHFTSYRSSKVVFDAYAKSAELPVRKLAAGLSQTPTRCAYRCESFGSAFKLTPAISQRLGRLCTVNLLSL
ncbi:MAG: LptF/LptG family permease [Deinococcales bacterium]